jgi:hypothetical protein
MAHEARIPGVGGIHHGGTEITEMATGWRPNMLQVALSMPSLLCSAEFRGGRGERLRKTKPICTRRRLCYVPLR